MTRALKAPAYPRRHSALLRGRSSSKKTGTSFVHRNSVPTFREELQAEFAVLVRPFSAGTLARASGATKEAAKSWKAGRRLPRLDHTIKMGQDIEAVSSWVEDQMRRPLDPRQIQSYLAQAYVDAQSPNAEVRATAWAFIRKVQGGSNDTRA